MKIYIYILFKEKFINLDDLIKIFSEININEIIYERKDIEELFKPVIIYPKKIEYIGIGLKKPLKGIQQGLIYSIEFIDYIATFNNEKVYIAIDIHGNTALNNLSLKECYITRLGGEGRTVTVKFSKKRYLWDKIRGLIDSMSSAQEYLVYMLTPSLMRTPLKDLKPLITPRTMSISVANVCVELLAGRLDILGAGFDIRYGVKKPVYASIIPGSLLRIKDKQLTPFEIYRKGLSEIGSKLGYGTFVPLPIS